MPAEPFVTDIGLAIFASVLVICLTVFFVLYMKYKAQQPIRKHSPFFMFVVTSMFVLGIIFIVRAFDPAAKKYIETHSPGIYAMVVGFFFLVYMGPGIVEKFRMLIGKKDLEELIEYGFELIGKRIFKGVEITETDDPLQFAKLIPVLTVDDATGERKWTKAWNIILKPANSDEVELTVSPYKELFLFNPHTTYLEKKKIYEKEIAAEVGQRMREERKLTEEKIISPQRLEMVEKR